MKTMATDAMPSARAASSATRVASRSSGVSIAAVGAHPLRHLGDARIEHRRLLDAAREDLGSRLIADLERVAEALAHDQQHGIALALEQRVGGDRGAHLDAADQRRRQLPPARAAEQIGDAGNGRVRISLRVLGEQLVGEEAPVRRPRHDVGEGAAAVDEELPLAVAVSSEAREPRGIALPARAHRRRPRARSWPASCRRPRARAWRARRRSPNCPGTPCPR